ncbi:hypothetical protein CPB84DRAFT_1636430, partial [Gymnopilus junonius]
FWVEVDHAMDRIAEKYKTVVQISGAYLHIYNADKLKYGKPKDMSHTVTEPKDIKKWQQTIAKHASYIHP